MEGQDRAVQVDPIKPTLKAPGTKRLKLKYDEVLSNFAFRFHLRRYTTDGVLVHAFFMHGTGADAAVVAELKALTRVVGRCRLTLSNPR